MIEPRSLPSNLFAERCIISGLLAEPERFGSLRDTLIADDFTTDRLRIYWRRMCEMYEAGVPLDRVTLAQTLQAHSEFEQTGGLSAIIDLDQGTPEKMNLEAYVKILRECTGRRRLMFVAEKLLIEASDSERKLADLVERAQGDVTGVTADGFDEEFRTPFQIIQDAGGIDAYCNQQAHSGIQWPWPTLTSVTSGSQPGDLVVIAGDTGRGKTAFVVNAALYAAKLGHGTAIFSLEMKRYQITNRLLALQGQFNSRIFRSGKLPTQTILESASTVAELPIYIRDSSECTCAGLVGAVRRLKAKRDVKLVIVDYLQLASGDGRSRYEQVSAVVRGLKNAAMELDLPIMALSQFSRDHSKNKTTPELHDLKETGEIENAAQLVLFIHGQTKYETRPTEFLPLELIVAKQRDGPSHLTIPMLFRADCGWFVEAER